MGDDVHEFTCFSRMYGGGECTCERIRARRARVAERTERMPDWFVEAFAEAHKQPAIETPLVGRRTRTRARTVWDALLAHGLDPMTLR